MMTNIASNDDKYLLDVLILAPDKTDFPEGKKSEKKLNQMMQ